MNNERDHDQMEFSCNGGTAARWFLDSISNKTTQRISDVDNVNRKWIILRNSIYGNGTAQITYNQYNVHRDCTLCEHCESYTNKWTKKPVEDPWLIFEGEL